MCSCAQSLWSATDSTHKRSQSSCRKLGVTMENIMPLASGSRRLTRSERDLPRRRVRRRPSVRLHLVVNPRIGPLQAIAQACGWLPIEERTDERVVAITAVHAFRGGEVIGSLQLQT